MGSLSPPANSGDHRGTRPFSRKTNRLIALQIVYYKTIGKSIGKVKK